MRASLTHSCRSRLIEWLPIVIARWVCQRSKYDCFHGELAQMSATTVATTSTMPPAASVLEEVAEGADDDAPRPDERIFVLCHTVWRSLNRWILPVAVLGNDSMTTTRAGRLKPASRCRQCSITSVSLTDTPGFATT